MTQLTADLIRTMYAYNAWANGRVLDAAERLSVAQLITPVSVRLSSIRDTLVHTLDVQQNWLRRFQRLDPVSPLQAQDFPDLASLRRRWESVEADTQSFVVALDDSALTQPIHYVNDKYEPNVYPLWQMMMHQVNHATQHRSEAAAMLTELGSSPGWLDFLIYVDSTIK